MDLHSCHPLSPRTKASLAFLAISAQTGTFVHRHKERDQSAVRAANALEVNRKSTARRDRSPLKTCGRVPRPTHSLCAMISTNLYGLGRIVRSGRTDRLITDYAVRDQARSVWPLGGSALARSVKKLVEFRELRRDLPDDHRKRCPASAVTTAAFYSWR
jgi:hypothetical protein